MNLSKKSLLAILLLTVSISTCLAQINPDSVDKLTWRRYGINDSTIAIAKRMIVAKPYEPYLHLVLGQALLRSENNDEAHGEFIKALNCSSIKKLHSSYFEEIANKMRFKFDDYKGSIQAADSMLIIHPTYQNALEIKAYSLLRLELYDSSISAYEFLVKQTLKNNPKGTFYIGEYYAEIAEAYEGKKDFGRAVQYYTDAIQVGNNFGDNYRFRGKCKNELSDYRGAISDFNVSLSKSVEKDWRYYSALSDRMYAKIMLKLYAEVIIDASTIINGAKQKSTRAYAYYLRGGAKHELKNKVGACLDWSKAGELGEDSAYQSIKQFCD